MPLFPPKAWFDSTYCSCLKILRHGSEHLPGAAKKLLYPSGPNQPLLPDNPKMFKSHLLLQDSCIASWRNRIEKMGTHSLQILQPASKRNGKTSTCCQFPRIFFRYSIAALQQWAHFETLMAQLIRAGLCQRPRATCQLTSSRSLPMAAGIYPGPRWTGTCAGEGHVFFMMCDHQKWLSRRSMRHQEAIDERLIKGIDADWHVYLRIIKGRQNESSRFGGARLMNM